MGVGVRGDQKCGARCGGGGSSDTTCRHACLDVCGGVMPPQGALSCFPTHGHTYTCVGHHTCVDAHARHRFRFLSNSNACQSIRHPQLSIAQGYTRVHTCVNVAVPPLPRAPLQGMEGMEAGQERKFRIQIPQDYPVEVWQGMDADVRVRVHQVFEWQLPEVRGSWGEAVAKLRCSWGKAGVKLGRSWGGAGAKLGRTEAGSESGGTKLGGEGGRSDADLVL